MSEFSFEQELVERAKTCATDLSPDGIRALAKEIERLQAENEKLRGLAEDLIEGAKMWKNQVDNPCVLYDVLCDMENKYKDLMFHAKVVLVDGEIKPEEIKND